MGGITAHATKVIRDAGCIHDTTELVKMVAMLEKASEQVTGWSYLDLFGDYHALEMALKRVIDMSNWTLEHSPQKLGLHIMAMANAAREALDAERIK